jgi:hypothetical protein
MFTTTRNFFCLLCIGACVIMLHACGPDIPADEEILARLPEKVDFNYHIKPLLSDRCYSCHGPDHNTREAGLRLDIEKDAFATLKSGKRAIVGGSLGRSEIFDRIYHEDPHELMPPPESNLELDDYEKALIAKWIKQGAEWKPHWAFMPPEMPRLPAVKGEAWPKNPIDHFVLENLEREGISPSEEADKERLLRRVSFDLTGLPPTLEEIDNFLKDDSENAYEKVVDRLLASKAYGERMAMEWMDVARYADSHGLHADGWRMMWPWRDWVIEAFNENMPFDQFVTWQMAGDLLPDATREQKLATAFHRNHPMTAEGGAIDEEWRLEYVFDRSNTTAKAFMGLTMECARCHDHKFDPISQKEFYQTAAFFNNVHELGMTGDDGNYGPSLMLPDSATESAIDELTEKIQAKEKKWALSQEEVTSIEDFIRNTASLPPVPNPVRKIPLDKINIRPKNAYLDQEPTATLSKEANFTEGKKGKALKMDNEYLNLKIQKVGNFETYESFSAGIWVYPEVENKEMVVMGTAGDKNNFWRGWDLSITKENQVAARLIHSLPHNYIHVSSEETIPANAWMHLMFTYDGSEKAAGLKLYINGKPTTSQVHFDRLYKSIKTINSGNHSPTDRPILVGKSYRAFTGDNGIFEGNLDEIQLYQQALTPLEVAQVAENTDLLDKYKKIASVEDKAVWQEYIFRRQNSEAAKLRRELKELRAERLKLTNPIDEVMVMEEMTEPRPMFILDRGVYDAPMEEVKPDIPAELGKFPDDLPRNRLGFAKWLLRRDHPTTARVTVNRYWQMYFGQGIVNTPQDFGNQGSLPSHPELLDWLALTFIDSGWDIKTMQKLMVMSATYRQSSISREDLREKDPYNILLARGPQHRLSAEMIRDNALAASGLLVDKIGGPSVKPYQPEGLWIDKGSFSHKLLHYKQDEGEGLYRRTLYTFIRRTSPPPSLMAFDASDRNVCVVRRQNTNTPMQALIMLNDPQYVEAARILGERMMKEGGEKVDDQIQHGFRLVTGRKAQAEEIALFKELYHKEYRKFSNDTKSAQDLMKTGDMPRDDSLDLKESAAMAMVASLMINHDEAYTKR